MVKIQSVPTTETCAFMGAFVTLSEIRGCVPYLHAGPGCGYQCEWFTICGGGIAGPEGSSFSLPSSDLVERDVIFGGEDKLYNTLIHLDEIYEHLGVVFIITGCISDIIGDDVKKVMRRAREKMGSIPILHIESGGFKGPASYGANLVLNEIAKELVKSPEKKRENTVNMLGLIPYHHPYWYGDMQEIKRILNLLGIEVNAFLPGDCDKESLERMAEASLNVVLSDHIGLPAARIFQQKYDMPFVYAKNGVPIGMDATKEFFMEVSRNLSLDLDEVEKKLKREEDYVHSRFARSVPTMVHLQHMTYAVVAPSAYAIGLVRFLTDELPFFPAMIALISYGEESEQTIKGIIDKQFAGIPCELLERPRVLINPTGIEIEECLQELKPDFIFARSTEGIVAKEIQSYFVPISWPVTDRLILDTPYMGYRGAIRFVEDMLTAPGRAYD